MGGGAVSALNYERFAERLAKAVDELTRGNPDASPAARRARNIYDEYRKAQRDLARARDESRQGGLFPSTKAPVRQRPYVRQDTSIEAAGAMTNARAESIRLSVLTELRLRPQTDQELAERLGVSGNTIRPRRIELVESGMVRDSGERRLTKAKRKAIVWEASYAVGDRPQT